MTGSDPTGSDVARRYATERDAGGELDQIRDHAEGIRDRQVARALTRLDARGELTPRRREEIERLADRLVDRLLATPAEALDAPTGERDETAETLIQLFDD